MAHGEQYLKVAPALYNDELLDAIRPWMTLDSDPADHQRLNNQLEGWSLFSAGNYVFVARLASAGIYDRRAAYFTHARAWSTSQLPQGFDPGLHLGRSDAFDEPWQNAPSPATAHNAPPSWPAQVKSDPELATRVLGHLLQAMSDDRGSPLIIAAPIGAFVPGGTLHGIACFARAALPSRLRDQCRVRIYSRLPELFLRHLGTHLLVIPEDAASSALAARPSATLLDQQGRRVAGPDLDDRARDYAAAVAERAVAIPDGLPHFSERAQRFLSRKGLPSTDEARAVQITYNLAYASAGTEERRAEMLRKYLPRAASRLGAGIDWDRLISADEWRDFSTDAVIDVLLADSRALSAGGREFLRKVEDEASRRGLAIDDRLETWWDPEDQGKVQRLVELLDHDPPLVPRRTAAERTARIPIERLKDAGSLAQVLQNEADSGTLSRGHESSQLASVAKDEQVFEVLSRAVAENRLDPGWASEYVRLARQEDVVDAARRWAGFPRFFSWREVPGRLLQRLRHEGVPELEPFAQKGLDEVDPVVNLETYLLSAELLTSIGGAAARPPAERVMTALRAALPRLSDSDVARLEAILFDPAWHALELSTIDLLLLLDLAAGFRQEDHVEQFYRQLDSRMADAPEATTRALAQTGWWYFWRTRSRLNPESQAIERSAQAWLTAPAWRTGLEPTLEGWEQAVKDLPRNLSGEMVARLRRDGDGRPWPWIPPFENDQLEQIIGRTSDLGALVEIAEALQEDRSAPFLGPVFEHVLRTSHFADQLPSNALDWLRDERTAAPKQPLSLPQSLTVCRHAGHRSDRALQARIASVLDSLRWTPHEALKAADQPNLWNNKRFLSGIAVWMNEQGSLGAMGRPAADWIDQHVDAEAVRPHGPAAVRTLVEELFDNGYENAARLLNPALQEKLHEYGIAEGIIQALIRGRSDDVCWEKLAREVKNLRPTSLHPVRVLADRIREEKLTGKERADLMKHGWQTFAAAAERHPSLMTVQLHQAADLPVFNLATSMLGPGSIGRAALQVAYAPASKDWRHEIAWWRTLIRSLRDFRRFGNARCADDREGYALALLLDAIQEPGEHFALETALTAEATNDRNWGTLSEFVESRL